MIDSQFYIIDSLSLHVLLEWNANLVVAWLYLTENTDRDIAMLP